jgi:dTDP-4-dehydrorhamnose reductase
MSMNILVTGGQGQLGSEFNALTTVYPRHNLFVYGHADLDVTSERAVETAMARHSCNVLINCAAFTSVDRAETDPDVASEVNRKGAGVLARATSRHGALLIHFSTYYVFDGLSSRPYAETDPPSPLGVYGRTKFEGEEIIREIDPSHLIIRTGWLYSRFGANFVKTILRLGSERDRIEVVSDRTGSPTHAAELATSVMGMLEAWDSSKRFGATYHFANPGACSWYDLAVAVMDAAGLTCKVVPVGSSAFPAQGPRPWYSVMDSATIQQEWNLEISHWQKALREMLKAQGSRYHTNG